MSESRPTSRFAGQTGYRVPRHPAPVDLHLDGNEGAVPPPDLLDALAARGPDAFRRYPDAAPLAARIAARLGLAAEQVMVTAGADEAIERLCRAVLAPGRALVLPVPSFEMIERYARIAGGELVAVPWPGGAFPRAAVLEAIAPETALIAVVSPNNPTGAVASAEDLRALSAAAPQAVLLVDLAYGEFADEDLTPAALALPNAVVTRTFSKAWGLAGLRVGYAAGPAEIVGWMRAAGGPYAVASASLALAEAWLERADGEVARFVARVRGERERLAARLARLGARPEPSQANFAFARFRDARFVRDALAGLGIAVRHFAGRPGLEDALRITCPGNDAARERLERALDAALAPQALLFDLDGVLADVSRSFREAIVRTAAGYGVTITRDEVSRAKAAGGSNNDWVLTRELLAARGVERPLDEVTAAFEAIYHGTTDAPGVRATERLVVPRAQLLRLAARLPLGLVTGRPRPDTLRFLDEQGIADLFGTVVTMDDAPEKPDPAPVRLALERLGAARGWMLGDTVHDIRAARGAGVVPLGIVAPGEDAERVTAALFAAGAARVLASVAELEDLLP